MHFNYINDAIQECVDQALISRHGLRRLELSRLAQALSPVYMHASRQHATDERFRREEAREQTQVSRSTCDGQKDA